MNHLISHEKLIYYHPDYICLINQFIRNRLSLLLPCENDTFRLKTANLTDNLHLCHLFVKMDISQVACVVSLVVSVAVSDVHHIHWRDHSKVVEYDGWMDG